MSRFMLASVLSIGLAIPTYGQSFRPVPDDNEGGAPRPARADGIPSALAVEAAQIANATCAALGLKTTALIVDSAGAPIAMISADGAAQLTHRLASGKAVTATRLKMSSGEARQAAQIDLKLRDRLVADPEMGPPRAGAFPILKGEATLGAIAVSGAPTGVEDEPCARAGLAWIMAGLGRIDGTGRMADQFDASAITTLNPADMKFEGASGETRAKLYGNPAKPGPYAILYKWEPGHHSRPHSHKVDRNGYVISGTWWMSTSRTEDVRTLRPVPAGTFVTHKAGKVHWDGAVDSTAIVLVTGVGPIETDWLDEGKVP